MLAAGSGTLTPMTPVAQPRRIVLATFGSPGDLHPFLAIGAELRARGHHVTVATSEVYRQAVAGAGLGFAAARPDRRPDQREPDFFDRLVAERGAPGDLFRAMFLPSLRESAVDLLAILKGADAVVAHTLASAARLAAEARGVPWISAVMQPMGYLSAHEPPVVGPGMIAATLRRLGPGPTRRLFALARTATNSWAAEWRELRAELGLPATTDHPLWEGQHSPRRSLGLFPHCLGAPQADWPAAARVTGFPFFRAPNRAIDPALDAFIAAGDPPLVFTLGTTAVNDPGAFYVESLAAARRLERRSVLIVGRGQPPDVPATGGDHIAVPYAPHDLLFPRALAIVHQGGIGTLSETLLAGKPSLIMPYAHDQADNAWRAARLGVARVIPRRRYRAAAIARELERLLGDPAFGAAAGQIARRLTPAEGARCAAQLIESAMDSSAAAVSAPATVRTPSRPGTLLL